MARAADPSSSKGKASADAQVGYPSNRAPGQGLDEQADAPAEFEPNPVMHLLAPVIAITATMVVRKVLNVGYEQVTGNKPPAPRDPSIAFRRAVVWAVVTAATAAAVETAVYRIANQAGRSRP
jgi:hypothetical protein